MEPWEYHIEKFTLQSFPAANAIGIVKPQTADNTYDTVQKRLNELGGDGWELMAITPPLPAPAQKDAALVIYYFKRPKN